MQGQQALPSHSAQLNSDQIRSHAEQHMDNPNPNPVHPTQTPLHNTDTMNGAGVRSLRPICKGQIRKRACL